MIEPPRRFLRVALLLSMALPTRAEAQSEPTRHTSADSGKAQRLAGVRVQARTGDVSGTASSASEGRIGAAALQARPLRRSGDLLEAVPGMVVTQHSGEGKANQFFIRGMNLDHGTDFQTRVDGMPLNTPTHVHGQGYTDLNILIPELVERIDYRLGTHHASLGDFGGAGGAEVHTVRAVAQPFVSLEGGRFGHTRVVAGGSRTIGRGVLLLGGEGRLHRGPWIVDQALQKANGLARFTWGPATSQRSLLAMAYRSRWDASDQVPLRAVTAGALSRFGQVDSTLGGEARRLSLSGSWTHAGGAGVRRGQAYVAYSDLDLYSNFTYLLDDPTNGDQFNQRERRVVVGLEASDTRSVAALGREHVVVAGLQGRLDLVPALGLHRTTRRRRVGTVREDEVTQSGTGLFAEATSPWVPWLRTVLGIRVDGYTAKVGSDNPANSGSRAALIASPKASVVVSMGKGAEVYLNGGLGFHSNDARGATTTIDPKTGGEARPVDPLVRARGAEVGLRVLPARGLRATASLWTLQLDSELLFAGDAGTTEAVGRSNRHGLTLAADLRPLPALTLDADVSLAHARFGGVAPEASRIPGALGTVVAGGIAWQRDVRGPRAALRLRHVGSSPLTEDNSVRAGGATLLNGEVGFRWLGNDVQLSVLNVLNSRVHDIQYFYVSRLPGEPIDGVADRHVHPTEPRQLRLQVRRDW